MHVIAAKAICLKEALAPEFREYAAQVVRNAQVMAESLLEEGFDLVTGGTDNHMVLADLRPLQISGKELQERCDENHMTLNKKCHSDGSGQALCHQRHPRGNACRYNPGPAGRGCKTVAHCIALTARDFEGTAGKFWIRWMPCVRSTPCIRIK